MTRSPLFLFVILSASAVTALVLPATLSAQGTIRGNVTATDGRPAAGAAVHIIGTTLGASV
ncbi:MAG: hypothetical protein ACR2MQ_10525, partial [Gemmatimonadaceae bacterium]